MIYAYTETTLARAEAAATEGDLENSYRVLRELPLADFCEVVSHVPARFPRLAGLLPSMPEEAVQKRWTGHSGRDLLTKSCSTVRLMQALSYKVRGVGIGAGSVVDYGCGWGRLTRLMPYFTETANVFGVDPMEDSIEACAADGVHGHIAQIGSVPTVFPFENLVVDFAFSYSVMTHTSLEATKAILNCLAPVMSSDGLYATTIRPIEFWTMRQDAFGETTTKALIRSHQESGYAFVPVGGGKELAKADYGDSSYSLEFFANVAESCGWKIACTDRDMLEPYQLTVMLSPKE